MIKYFLKFIFEDGSEFVPREVFDSPSEAIDHGEKTLHSAPSELHSKVLRYVVGIGVIRF